jgi:glycosyltransferase involved in cell wall biosynthesis
MNKEKVLIVNDNSLGLLGGEREAQLIILNGIKDKYNVFVIQPGKLDEQIEGVHIYTLTKSKRMKHLIKNPIAFIIYFFKLGRSINKISPKIMHTQSQVCFFMISLLRRLKLVDRNITFVHTDRGLYSKYNLFFKWLFQFSFRYLDVLVTTTEFNRNEWKKANKKKAIELEYKKIEDTAGEIYEDIDCERLPDNKDIVVGFAGRMCDWKGWDLAEEICDGIWEKSNSIKIKMCVICYDDKDVSLTNGMFDRISEKFQDRFEGKINVPFADMEQFYYDVDVYILTSWPKAESFGRTIVESMARKTAILMTDAGGSTEVLDNNDNVHCKSSEFVDHILLYDTNRDILLSEKERNFTRVHNVYSYDNNVNKHIELYRCLLKR